MSNMIEYSIRKAIIVKDILCNNVVNNFNVQVLVVMVVNSITL